MSGKKRSAEDDRRLGLLGAAAGRQEQSVGDCPSSEDLAAVVESQQELSEEYQHIAAHITSCHSCYQEWLAISREYGAQKKVRPTLVRFLSTPRYLAATGSAMAIAASVIVFFAIPQHKVTEVTQPQKVESMTYSLEESVTPMSEAEVLGSQELEREAMPMSAPLGDAAQRVNRNEEEKELIEKNMANLAKRKARASAPPVPLVKGEKASGDVELTMTDSVSAELSSIETYGQFAEYLQLVCESENNNLKDMEKVQEIAEKIISQSTDIGEGEYKKLESILSLYKRKPALTYRQICEQAAEIME